MAYMAVLRKTESHLRLLREPTFLSKTVFVGFLVGVSGVLIFGSESILFKVFIGIGAVFLSCFMVDNYEICDMNKETSKVCLSHLHFCQYFLGNIFSPRPYVTCNISDIRDVRVEKQENGDSQKMYRVVLVLDSGIQLGITEVYTNNDLSEHEKIIDTILSFIGTKFATTLNEDAAYESETSSSEEEFEQISKSEIEGLEEEIKMTEGGDTTEEIVKSKLVAATEEI